MNDFFQLVGTFASIFSVPLAIIIYFKTTDARQNKIRLEIIRSLSYRIGEGKTLNKMEVSAVFNSKIREYNLRKSLFTEISILEDMIADAVSNPFLTSEQKTLIIQDISNILESYGAVTKRESRTNNTDVEIKYIVHDSVENEAKRKRDLTTDIFSIVTVSTSIMLTMIGTLVTNDANDSFSILFSDYQVPSGILMGVVVSFIAAFLVCIVKIIIKKTKKK